MSVKRTKLITGSLRDPLFRYVISAKIVYNPFIYKDTKHFYDRFVDVARKFDRNKVQENFTWSTTIATERDLSIKNICTVGFIDESKHEFDFTYAEWDSFIWFIRWTNLKLYHTRNLNGFDDEFEDGI